MTGSAERVLGVDAGIAAVTRLVGDARTKSVAGQGECLIVAVDGPSGSGKSSLAGPLATAIAEALGGSVITLNEEAPKPGPRVAVVSTDLLATWEHPFDWWPALQEHLLGPLAAGRAARLPVIAWENGEPVPGGELMVPPVDVLVLEGVSSGRRAITDRLTALVWVEVPQAAVRLERAVGRDGEASRPYLSQWQRDEERHFLEDGTRGRATVVIDPD